MPPTFFNISSKCLRSFVGFFVMAGAVLLPAVPISAQSSERCDFLTSPQDLNTSEIIDGEENRIIIGQFEDRPYVVLLTRHLQEHFPSIRACIPDAFFTSSRLGSYIQIASFDNYRDARDLANHIDEVLDINVRVIHHNRLSR